MKTDRFSDSIRRKLESIRPDFSEKDWKRMQATLQQAAPPPSGSPTGYQPFTVNRWSARPWMLAAAAVSLVMVVSFAAWQRVQISDLRQTVSQLTRQTKTRPRQTLPQTAAPSAVLRPADQQTAQRGGTPSDPINQPAGRSQATATPDTVYITRYVAVPAQSVNPLPGRTAQRSADTPNAPAVDRADRTRLLSDVQPRQRQSTTTEPATTEQNNDVVDNASPVANGTIITMTDGTTNRPGTVDSPTRRTGNKAAMRPMNRQRNDETSEKKRPSVATATAPANGRRAVGNMPTTVPDRPTGEIAPGETGQLTATATYALTTGRPITMKAIDWNEALARQFRRMRPGRTTTVGGQAAPVSQPASQPVNRLALGFRIGAGGEVSRTVRSGSLQTELLIGNHLTLGMGLGLSSFAGGTFLTPEKFDERKQKKEYKPGGFKRNYVYGRGIDPHSDITNIGTHTTRVQIPISLGYRIPVSQTLSLLPSVGTTLGLQSKEFVTFTYRQPFGIYEEAKLPAIPRRVELLNNLTFSAGVEWKRNHWAVQVGPVVTLPLVADANWEGSTSLGLRARLFYQF